MFGQVALEDETVLGVSKMFLHPVPSDGLVGKQWFCDRAGEPAQSCKTSTVGIKPASTIGLGPFGETKPGCEILRVWLHDPKFLPPFPSLRFATESPKTSFLLGFSTGLPFSLDSSLLTFSWSEIPPLCAAISNDAPPPLVTS